jgi:hypothetical protein
VSDTGQELERRARKRCRELAGDLGTAERIALTPDEPDRSRGDRKQPPISTSLRIVSVSRNNAP